MLRTVRHIDRAADATATLCLAVLALAIVSIGGWLLIGLIGIAALGHLYRRHCERRTR